VICITHKLSTEYTSLEINKTTVVVKLLTMASLQKYIYFTLLHRNYGSTSHIQISSSAGAQRRRIMNAALLFGEYRRPALFAKLFLPALKLYTHYGVITRTHERQKASPVNTDCEYECTRVHDP